MRKAQMCNRTFVLFSRSVLYTFKFIFAIMCARATVWPAFIVGQTGKQTESWLTGRKKHWYVFIIRKRRMVI